MSHLMVVHLLAAAPAASSTSFWDAGIGAYIQTFCRVIVAPVLVLVGLFMSIKNLHKQGLGAFKVLVFSCLGAAFVANLVWLNAGIDFAAMLGSKAVDTLKSIS